MYDSPVWEQIQRGQKKPGQDKAVPPVEIALTDKKVIFQATFMFLLCELKLLWKNIKILYYRGWK